MRFNELSVYRESGRRAGKAMKRRDVALFNHESQWSRKAFYIEEPDYRREAMREWNEGYKEESTVTRY